MDIGLAPHEMDLIRGVFEEAPGWSQVVVFGSRAKGSHRRQSDIDLAVVGLNSELAAEALADALDALPLPYRFDVVAYDAIDKPALREHIDRVGIVLCRHEKSHPSAAR